METSKFDELASAVSRRIARRTVTFGAAGGILAHLGLAEVQDVDAGKKKKKKKKKGCLTAFGKRIQCGGLVCCDPATSTLAACTDFGYTTCCGSTGSGHPPGSVCCGSFFQGFDGTCTSEYPHCCGESVGAGCCLAGYPVCCDNDCCVAGDSCAPDGFCMSTFRQRQAGVERAIPSGRRRFQDPTASDSRPLEAVGE